MVGSCGPGVNPDHPGPRAEALISGGDGRVRDRGQGRPDDPGVDRETGRLHPGLEIQPAEVGVEAIDEAPSDDEHLRVEHPHDVLEEGPGPGGPLRGPEALVVHVASRGDLLERVREPRGAQVPELGVGDQAAVVDQRRPDSRTERQQDDRAPDAGRRAQTGLGAALRHRRRSRWPPPGAPRRRGPSGRFRSRPATGCTPPSDAHPSPLRGRHSPPGRSTRTWSPPGRVQPGRRRVWRASASAPSPGIRGDRRCRGRPPRP